VGACLVVDLYDPFPLEMLVLGERDPPEVRARSQRDAMLCLNEQLRQGDFFLCASEKQRDFWLGALGTLNRINPATYAADPGLRSLIAVVPFGIPAAPPRKLGPGPREVLPGIGKRDLVLLWGGGVYNWFDPLTLIRGVAEAIEDLPRLRLVFMGTGHPNPDVPEMWMLLEAQKLSEELGLTGKHVFFNPDWVDYDQRANWFLDADIGVSMHFDHVETRFSFRTRILDYFWAGLPVIATAGDTLADRIEGNRLGRTVPPEDARAVAEAIGALALPAERRAMAKRVREHAADYTWERAAEPLIRFCASPRKAPDLARGLQPLAIRDHSALATAGRLLRRTGEVITEGGPLGFVRAARRWLGHRRPRVFSRTKATEPESR
jgi:glycosyltransferase involved in cell wall biosynthesis